MEEIPMYKKRELPAGLYYHVTSRTNNKTRVFENNLGRKIMLITLQNAKDKFRFQLANFCVMPTHIHLLIKPADGTCLSKIMHWIKIHSAKYWNTIHGSTDHMWGSRFFARAVKDQAEYDFVIDYIDQNPVVVGLAATPEEWKASGAYYKYKNIKNMIDCSTDPLPVKLLSPIPPIVSRLIPPAQLEHTLQYYGVYADVINNLYKLVPTIPRLGESTCLGHPICLHYTTGTADYFIYEYDTNDTMYGKVRFNVYPFKTETSIFSLSALKKNEFLKLDFSWKW